MLLNTNIPFSYIFNKIKYDVIAILSVATVLLLITALFPSVLPEIPLTIPMFLGTAISILLSFKLNQSYDRWWEARKIWGSIVNDSRTLVLQLIGVMDSNPGLKKIAYRQIGWCYSLGQSLRGFNPIHNLEGFIEKEELEVIQSHSNKPLAILHHHNKDIQKLKAANVIDGFMYQQLDNTLMRLCDAQGKAERIKNSVFPVTYRKFLHFFIYLFLVTLSVSLNNVAYYYELPILLLISSAFFLLERSATHMQDPFEDKPTDTPVTAIARTIEINLKQLVNDSNIPTAHTPDTFFIK